MPPPTSKSHSLALEKMKNLKEKLQLGDTQKLNAQKNQNAEENNIMDMLIDLDIKGEQPEQQTQ